MRDQRQPFLGSAAIASGQLSRHQLRTRFRAVFPDVYVAQDCQATISQRISAAWVWSRGRGVIVGLSAAAVHGSRWIPDDAPIELCYANSRPPAGIVTRRAGLRSDEVELVEGRRVTTPARTAYDLGRRGNIRSAVARLDALSRATKISIDEVKAVAAVHPGSRGLRQLESVLELVDRGAESPQESYLRLNLIEGGLPPPQTQIAVYADDGGVLAYLDMGWPELMVAVEYDGDQHRSDRRQYLRDIRRMEMLEQLGWIVIRVVAEDHPADVLRRVRRALAGRQSSVN